MRVGPFNWTFGGKVTDVNVYDQNGQSISENCIVVTMEMKKDFMV